MTPDETAERILHGDLTRLTPTFAQFRQKMTEEHPTYLNDQEIHDLFVKHVTNYVAPGTEPAIDQAMAWLEAQPAHILKDHEEGGKVLDWERVRQQRKAKREAGKPSWIESEPEKAQAPKVLDMTISEALVKARKKFLSLFPRT